MEYSLVAPVGVRGFVDFRVGGGGLDDSILSGYLLAVPLAVFGFLLLVGFQFALEPPFQSPDLRVLCALQRGVRRLRRVELEPLDLVFDLSVEDLGLRDFVFELGGGGRFGRGEGALVEGGDLRDVRCEGSDAGSDGFDTGEEVLLREGAGAGGAKVRQPVVGAGVIGATGVVREFVVRRSGGLQELDLLEVG